MVNVVYYGMGLTAVAVCLMIGQTTASGDDSAQSDPRHNCSVTNPGSFACHVCYDSDGGSCTYGKVCCPGFCWKLHGDENNPNVIAKGCTHSTSNEKKNNGHKNNFNTKTQIGGKALKGTAYFCNDKDFCNGAQSPISTASAFFLTAIFTTLLASFYH